MLFCQLRSMFFTDLIFSAVSTSMTFDRYELVRLNDFLWHEQLHFLALQQNLAHDVHLNFMVSITKSVFNHTQDWE